MKVVIVGAGIGGLCTALRLHHTGIDCEVHERSERIGELGVGINLLPHAVRELAELDLLDGLEEAAVRTRELCYANRLGQDIVRRPCGLDAGFAFPQFSVHRGRLQGVLLRAVRERLGADAVRVGSRLVGVEQDASGVRARFADPQGRTGDAVPGDVLVAADGIHSTVRAAMFPDEGPPRWSGVMMWRGATDWPAFGTGGTVSIAGGTASKIVLYPIAPGSAPDTRLTNWAVCVLTGRDGDPPPRRQDWLRPGDAVELAGHLDRFRLPYVDHVGLVRATEQTYELPMCDRDPLPHWSDGRVTLLGDAAHPMYPMGSNGAGQAILDVTSLVGHLVAEPDPTRALRAYQDERLPATAEVVLRNRQGGPESVIDEVERRAPDGFDRLADVITDAEIEDVLRGYARAAGASPAQVNRPA